jgi:transposase
MRGVDARNGSLFWYVDLEARVPAGHPLRVIRRLADAVLAGMSRQFAAAYAPIGRPSIAAEKLLRALLLQALYTIRSERQLMERIDVDLLFRWFVGLGIDDAVWDASTFAKNRDRFLEMDAAAELLAGVVKHPEVRRQMSRDHFSVDGTLIDALPHALSGQLPEPVPPVAPLLPGASRACWPCSLRESDRWPPGHRSSARARPLWFAASVLGPASRAGPAPAARCAVPCGAAGTPQPRWGGALPVVKLKPRNLRRDGRSTPGVPMAACCHGVAALLAVFTRSWRRLVTKPVTLVITRSPARRLRT